MDDAGDGVATPTDERHSPMTEQRCPITLDRSGKDVQGELLKLREQHGRVARVELPDGVEAWSVLGHDLVKQVLTDARFQKDPRRHWPYFIDGHIPPDWQMLNWVVMDNMTTRDGEDHARLRRLISNAFAPRAVAAAQPLIEQTADKLVERLAQLPTDVPVDIKKLFAFPFPAEVICALFGVPEADREAALYGGVVNAATDITGDEVVASIDQYHETMMHLAELKKDEPGDDLTTLLLQARDEDGSGLSDDELVGTLHLMLGAGSETVMNLLGHIIVTLLTHPEQRALVEDGVVSWDDVIEEGLRNECPVANLPFRFATEDVELDGVMIKKGEPVMVAFASVGRDPELHGPTTHDFDARREDKTHLSFGYGRHFCIGSTFARLEARIALPRLFERFPAMTLAAPRADLPSQGTFIMNGYGAVPVYLGGPPAEPDAETGGAEAGARRRLDPVAAR